MLITSDDIAEKCRTVCITGPKPEKLPDSGNRNSQVIRSLKSVLYKAMLDCTQEGYNCFITGFTEGVELWAGEIVLDFKAQNKNVKLVVVSPYKDYISRFRSAEKFLAGNITLKADQIVHISEKYTGKCMNQRIEYMIARSGKLIAVVPDSKARKGAAIKYAESSGIITHIIDAGQFEAQIKENSIQTEARKRRKLLF